MILILDVCVLVNGLDGTVKMVCYNIQYIQVQVFELSVFVFEGGVWEFVSPNPASPVLGG